MKKYLRILFVVALLLSFSPLAFAQIDNPIDSAQNLQTKITSDTVTSTPDTTGVQSEQVKTEVEKIRDAASQKMLNFKVKIQAGKNKTKIEAGMAIISGREDALAKFDNAIAKLGILKDDVNTQIAKFELGGLKVENAKAEVDITTEKIAEAESKVADISTLFSNSASELFKDDKATLKQTAADIETLIQDAHSALNQAVLNLKEEMQNKINKAD